MPRPLSPATSPSRSSSLKAFCTVFGLTPSSSESVRTLGRSAPAAIVPRAIEARAHLVRTLIELAQLHKLESADRPTPSQQEAQIKLARSRFADARQTNTALDAALLAGVERQRSAYRCQVCGHWHLATSR